MTEQPINQEYLKTAARATGASMLQVEQGYRRLIGEGLLALGPDGIPNPVGDAATMDFGDEDLEAARRMMNVDRRAQVRARMRR